MLASVSRADNSIIARWWWSVDHWTISALLILVSVGALLSFAASPAVAQSSGLGLFSLAQKHLVFLPIATGLMICVSLMNVRQVRLLALATLVLTLVVLALLPFIGNTFNGSTRWISIAGVSIQPSEFAKPCFALTSAWLLARQHHEPNSDSAVFGFGLFAVLLSMLILQPDVGQAFLITSIFLTQLFLAGLSLRWVFGIFGLGVATFTAAYFMFGHVKSRVDLFFSGEAGASYQVGKSIQSFVSGGMFGKGPGEGEIKTSLPDAHSDFVFAVLGEEFGLIACYFVLLMIAFIVVRGLVRAASSRSLFILLAISGLLTQFGLQSFVNMATSLNMMPTKGMTLPFVSYGGSSMMAIGLAMGFLLALSRTGAGENMQVSSDFEPMAPAVRT